MDQVFGKRIYSTISTDSYKIFSAFGQLLADDLLSLISVFGYIYISQKVQ